MRRLATALSALAFLWGCAGTVYLLVVASPAGLSRAATFAASGGAADGRPPPLATAEGVWVAALGMGIALLAGVPLGLALTHDSGRRPAALIVGFTLLAFCALSGAFVGMLYLPTAFLLLVSGALARTEPRAAPHAGLRA